MTGWPDSREKELVWGGGASWCPFLQQTSALEGMTWHRAQGVRRWDSQKSTMPGSEAEWCRRQQSRSRGCRLADRQASQMQRPCSSHGPASRVPRRGRLSTPGGTIAEGVQVQSVGCEVVSGYVGGDRGASAVVVLSAAVRGFWRDRASHSAVRLTRSGGVGRGEGLLPSLRSRSLPGRRRYSSMGGPQQLLQHALGLRAAEENGPAGYTRGAVYSNRCQREDSLLLHPAEEDPEGRRISSPGRAWRRRLARGPQEGPPCLVLCAWWRAGPTPRTTRSRSPAPRGVAWR